MPLFKVWSRDRKKKIFVIVEDENALLNLIAKASEKLQINGSSIVLEEDGTSINEDEVLLYVHNQTIMLLQQGEQWGPREEERNTPSFASTSSTMSVLQLTDNEGDVELPNEDNTTDEAISFNKNSTLNSTESMSVKDVPTILVDKNMEFMWTTFQIPWYKLSKDTLSACEQGQRKKEIITEVIHMVANEMRFYKQTPSSKATRIVAQQLINTYPKMFQDIDDDGVVLGDGSISIYMKLYERLSYLNRPHKRPSTGSAIPKKKIKHAVAGCKNWNPDTSVIDDSDCNILKQKLNDMQNATIMTEEMNNLLEKTYPLQREFINNTEKQPTVDVIKTEWPILFNKVVLIWHFQKVCESAEIMNFLHNLEEKADKILKLDKENLNKTVTDRHLQLLMVISHHFKEDLSKIFKSVQDSAENIDSMDLQPCIVEVVSNDDRKLYIYYEKQPVMEATTIGEALHLLLGIYFVFNLVYPTSVSCLLEFLQRYILKIHPDEGTKSKKMNYSKRKVISFLNKITKM